MGLCPPCSHSRPVSLPHPSRMPPVPAPHPSLHAERGVWLCADPAEPAKHLKTPTQGGQRRGNKVPPPGGASGFSRLPAGGPGPGGPAAGPSAGLQGHLVATSPAAAPGSRGSSAGQGCTPGAGAAPGEQRRGIARLQSRGTAGGAGRLLSCTASPEQPQLLLFCRKKEQGN